MGVLAKADANPTKSFFVRMITKDISLEDCILDLIDNSVDGAWKLSGGVPMALDDAQTLSDYRIEVEISADEFLIADNCGGISLDDAVNYAFTFGRKDEDAADNYSIGVYGIGMKRAVFKMGTDVLITSTYEESGALKAFDVPIDVNAWLANDDRNWDFDLESSEGFDSHGVKIRVRNLNEETSLSFGSPAFLQNLRRVISRDYALHLARGLSISVNGQTISGWKIELLQGGEFLPMRADYLEEVQGGRVRVEIIAGMAAPPEEGGGAPEDGEKRDDRNGWYVVCNGRIVVAADKSALTGWGTDGWPQWHPQYAGFVGIVLFTSEQAALLPLTTTKRSVNSSSKVYRRAQGAMREATKAWIGYTNERKHSIDDARKIELSARPVAIKDIVKRESVSLPKLSAKPPILMANVGYSVPKESMRKLADAFGDINMAYREVGVRSFDYAFSELVGGE